MNNRMTDRRNNHRPKIVRYNRLIRQIAAKNTQHLGVDTPEQRISCAFWLKRVRREFPFSSQVRPLVRGTSSQEALRGPVRSVA